MRAIAVFCLAAAPLWAQPPAIRTGGVVNAASRMPSMLPGGAIGRGALFDIVGVRLGTGDQATSVTVSAAGARVRVPLLAVSPQRIAARMPAGAPLGDLSLTVTVDGAASPPYPLQVTRGNFGIFSRNREGWGPGRVDNVAPDRSRSANSLANSARPGQALVLAGTGLGDARPEVWVGSRRAFVETVRRGTAGAAADEISFRLPPGTPEGCFVPLVRPHRGCGGAFAHGAIARRPRQRRGPGGFRRARRPGPGAQSGIADSAFRRLRRLYRRDNLRAAAAILGGRRPDGLGAHQRARCRSPHHREPRQSAHADFASGGRRRCV